MTLNEFIDIWTRKNSIVYICPDRYYDEMFDLIDDIDEGMKKIEEIFAYTICAFIPNACDFKVRYYLKDEFAYAIVKNFYIHDGYIIIWIAERR